MSQTARESNQDAREDDKLVDREEEDENITKNPSLHVLTEAVLIVASIPSIIFFLFGIVTGLLLLVQQDEHAR